MISDLEKVAALETTLKLTPSILRDAKFVAQRTGVSLDDFVDTALADKLDHLQKEWIESRKPVTEAMRAEALAILDRAGSDEVEPGDELPEGYVSPVLRSTL